MEDQIQFTYIFKTLIQSLHKHLRDKKKQMEKRKPLLAVTQMSHVKVKGASLECPLAPDEKLRQEDRLRPEFENSLGYTVDLKVIKKDWN